MFLVSFFLSRCACDDFRNRYFEFSVVLKLIFSSKERKHIRVYLITLLSVINRIAPSKESVHCSAACARQTTAEGGGGGARCDKVTFPTRAQ